MTVSISKNVEKNNILDVLGGTYPDYHPEWYFGSRLRDGMVLIAKLKDDIAGFLCYTILWGNTPYIELIKIKKPFQRQGIGTKLLKEAIEDIKEIAPYKVLMSSSEVINDMGNAFHGKFGFEEVAVMPMLHGEERFYKLDLGKVE